MRFLFLVIGFVLLVFLYCSLKVASNCEKIEEEKIVKNKFKI